MTTLLEDDHLDPVAYVREKFKLPADAVIDPALAKSKYEADEFIKMKNAQFDTLSADYQRLKADYDSRASLEELLTKAQIREPEPQLTPNANKTQPSQSIDRDEVAKLYQDFKRQEKADANLAEVKQILKEKLGSKVSEVLRTKMDELELTQEEMDRLAARSPKAFMRTMGLEDQPTRQPNFQTPPASTYNSATFKPVTEKRTWSYYQDLKAKDPKAWLDPKIQTQMYHDAQRLGSDFGDGDFAKYDERL
jgi:curved DNA-binding protein CbpA